MTSRNYDCIAQRELAIADAHGRFVCADFASAVATAAKQTFYFGAAYDSTPEVLCVDGKKNPNVRIELHGAFAVNEEQGSGDSLAVHRMNLDTHDYSPAC